MKNKEQKPSTYQEGTLRDTDKNTGDDTGGKTQGSNTGQDRTN